MDRRVYYLIWVVATILFCGMYGYLTKKVNDDQTTKSWIILYAYGAILMPPLWMFMGHYSTNLTFDTMLASVLMTVSFTGVMIIAGSAAGFSWINWVGVLIVLIGFILLRL